MRGAAGAARLGKGVRRGRLRRPRRRRLAPPDGGAASSSSSGGTGSDGPFLPGLLRAHVVPSNEQGDGVAVVNRLDGDAGRRRMERASGLHDLPDDRKAGHGSGGEARGSLGEIDRVEDVLGDDEVGVAGPVAPRERDDEVGDRPALLGLERIGERRHGRAVEPGAHRPEDVLAGRASPEGPALREVRRADRMSPVVRQGWRRRSVAPAERAVALDAAVRPRRVSSRARRTPSSLSARSGGRPAWGHSPAWRSRGKTS